MHRWQDNYNAATGLEGTKLDNEIKREQLKQLQKQNETKNNQY